MQELVIRCLLYSSPVSLDLALFQDSNGLFVKATLRLEIVSMPIDLVKLLEVEAPSLGFDNFFESEKSLLPLLLKLPMLTLVFLKIWCKCRPFPFTVSATITVSTKYKGGSRTPQRVPSRITL